VQLLAPDAVRDAHPGHRAGYLADLRPRPMGADLELAGRRRDGSTFLAEISLSAIDTAEGILVTAAVRDVSERRAAEATAARLASIVQSSHDAIIGETLDRIITSWNPAAGRLYGHDAADAVGRHIDLLISPETQVQEQGIQAAITRGERIGQFESERVRKDGTERGLLVKMSEILSAPPP
jgi:two-component system, cell cycle sensor histidine kinase and response regulator CckA